MSLPHILRSSSSDAEKDREMLGQIQEANSLFDQIFHAVATTRQYNQPPLNPQLTISASTLNDAQCTAVTRLAGYLKSIHDHWQQRILDLIQRNAGLTDLSLQLTQDFAEQRSITHLERKVFLLQDYLVNEVNRNEELEAKIATLEGEMVKILEEKSKLEKKAQQCQPSVSEKPRAKFREIDIPDHPEEKFGKYIRKPFGKECFFGLIANFTDPYFQIVYEDADFEDMSNSDVEQVLWKFPNIPTSKQQACLKHAKKLQLLHPSLLNANNSNSSSVHTNNNSVHTTESAQSAGSSGSQDLPPSVHRPQILVHANPPPPAPQPSENNRQIVKDRPVLSYQPSSSSQLPNLSRLSQPSNSTKKTEGSYSGGVYSSPGVHVSRMSKADAIPELVRGGSNPSLPSSQSSVPSTASKPFVSAFMKALDARPVPSSAPSYSAHSNSHSSSMDPFPEIKADYLQYDKMSPDEDSNHSSNGRGSDSSGVNIMTSTKRKSVTMDLESSDEEHNDKRKKLIS